MNKFNGYTNPDFALIPVPVFIFAFFRPNSRVKQNTWVDSANQLIPNRLLKKKNGVFTRHNLLSLN